MATLSSRDLRNHTATVLRRVEGGERFVITVSLRPVAELAPLEQPAWASGASIGSIALAAFADRALLRDLAFVREQGVNTS